MEAMSTIVVSCRSAEEADLFRQAGADEIAVPAPAFSFTGRESTVEPDEDVSWLLSRPLFPEDLPAAEAWLRKMMGKPFACLYAADYAWLQLAGDLGLARRMIYRPETLLTSPQDALFFQQSGFPVSISPLLSSAEICSLLQVCPQAEITVFGRTMLACSARQLLSAYQQETGSALSLHEQEHLFLQEETRPGRMPVYEGPYGTIILNDQILQSYQELRSFQQAGGQRFFLQGLGVSVEITRQVLLDYRAILHGAEAGSLLQRLCEQYPDQDFSTGYYHETALL